MGRLKIGVMIESFRLGVRQGIEKAAAMGADGFQLYVTEGEMAPENLTRSGRREFRKFVADKGLVISALCVELGGYTGPDAVDEKIDRTLRMLDLGVDLGVAVHSGHIGVIPEDPKAKERLTLADALRTMGAYAAERGRCLAAETGPEDTALMHDFLASIGSEGVKVNFDPANLVMNGYDPVRGVYELADFIVHTHAKDGFRRPDGAHGEVPLGKGEVPWDAYVGALRGIGYEGFYTIEREVGADPAADILEAKKFLEKL